MDTPRLRGGEYRVFPPPAMGRRRGGPRPKGQGLDEAVGWTPRGCGVENIECSPRPRWAGGAVDPARRGLEEAVGWTPRGCGVENIECSPPPAMGRRRGGPRKAGS